MALKIFSSERCAKRYENKDSADMKPIKVHYSPIIIEPINFFENERYIAAWGTCGKTSKFGDVLNLKDHHT
jgi:hypothetical protein